MSDRPVIFSAPMIRALLDGRKTQTRRVLKPQPGAGQSAEMYRTAEVDWQVRDRFGRVLSNERLPYAAGDRLWVREAWRAPAMNDGVAPRDLPIGCARKFEADGEEVIGERDDVVPFPIGAPGRYRHARFMPRWASRLTLLVSEVRVQRLQDISEEDAFAEGLEKLDVTLGLKGEVIPLAHPQAANEWARGNHGDGGYAQDGWDRPCAVYADLWNSIHGPDAWSANPWIVALTFQTVRANIDVIQPESVS